MAMIDLGVELTDMECDAVFRVFDQDGGGVEFSEFQWAFNNRRTLEKEIKAEVLADNSTKKEKAYEMSREQGDVPISAKSEQVLTEMFKVVDKQNQGLIPVKEFDDLIAVCERCMPRRLRLRVFEHISVMGQGMVNMAVFHEFIVRLIVATFQLLDADDSNSLDMEESQRQAPSLVLTRNAFSGAPKAHLCLW